MHNSTPKYFPTIDELQNSLDQINAYFRKKIPYWRNDKDIDKFPEQPKRK